MQTFDELSSRIDDLDETVCELITSVETLEKLVTCHAPTAFLQLPRLQSATSRAG
jgi:hypothetical protein